METDNVVPTATGRDYPDISVSQQAVMEPIPETPQEAAVQSGNPIYFDDSGTPTSDLVHRVSTVESSNNPYAVSPVVHAKGLMQLMDSTGQAQFNKLTPDEQAQYGGEYNPFNSDLNKKLGTNELKDLYTRFKDPRLALAGYNMNPDNLQKLRDKYGPNYEDVAPHLPEETQKYVPKVLGTKAPSPAKVQAQAAKLPTPDITKVGTDAASFADVATPIVSDPHYPSLPFTEKAAALTKLINGKAWDADAYDLYRKQMDVLWQSADPNEIAPISSFVTPAPVVADNEDPDKVLGQWRAEQNQALEQKGVNPAFFGNQLNNYFDSATQTEKANFARRTKSYLGAMGDLAYKAATGFIDIPIGIEAGVARLAGTPIFGAKAANDFADRLQANVNILGKDRYESGYEIDDKGALKLDKNNQPIEKFSSKVATLFGNTMGFLAGGEAIGALKMAAMPTYLSDVGMNSLFFANSSFKNVYDKTGNVADAYKASLWSVPEATVAGAGQFGVVSKMLNPSMKGLSSFSKSAYVADVMARNALAGGLGMGGADLIQQFADAQYTGDAIDYSRTLGAVAGAAGAGALLSGAHATMIPGTTFAANREARDNPPAPEQTPWPPLSTTLWSAPQKSIWPPPALPAPLGPLNYETPLGLPSPYKEGPPTKRTLVNQETADAVTAKVQAFRESKHTSIDLTADEANNLPVDMLKHSDVLLTPKEGGSYTVTRQSDYIPVESADLTEAHTNIVNLEAALAERVPPKDIPAVTAEYNDVNAKVEALTSKYSQAAVRAVKDRAILKNQYDAAVARKANIPDTTSPEYLSLLHEIHTLNDSISTIDASQDFDPNSELANLSARQQKLKKQVDPINLIGDKHYENNYYLMDNNLKGQRETYAKMRAELEAKGAIPANATDVSNGLPVEGHTIVNEGDKWYTVSPQGKLVGGAHDHYYDAVRAARDAKNTGELSDSTQFLMRQEDPNGKLTPEQNKAIEDRVASDLKDKLDNEKLSLKQQEIARKEAKRIYRRDYAAQVRANRIEAAKKGILRKGGKAIKVKEGAVSENSVISEAAQGISASAETRKANPTFAEKLKPDWYSQQRRRVNPPKRELDSNYTPLVDFAQDSTKEVPVKQVNNAIAGWLSSFSKIPIFMGGRQKKGTRGYLDPVKRFIKVGVHNDPQTTMHEATHAFDQDALGKWATDTIGDYSSIPRNIQERLKDHALNFYNFSPDHPPSEDLKIKEGLAMFFQHYASGQPVPREVLAWYHGDFAKEHSIAYKGMEQVKNLMHDFYNQTPATYSASRIISNENTEDSTTIKNRLKNYWTQKNLIDQWARKSQWYKEVAERSGKGEKNIHDIKKALQFRSASLLDTIFSRGRTDLAGNPIPGEAFNQIFEKYKGLVTEKDAANYLLLWNDRAQAIKGGVPGVDPRTIEDAIAELDHKNEHLAQLRNDINDWRNYKDALLLSADPATAFMVRSRQKANVDAGLAPHGDYMPTQREGKGGFSSKKAKSGSTERVVNPLANYKEAVAEELAQAFKHMTMYHLTDIASSNIPSSVGSHIREVTGGARIGLLKEIEAEAIKPGETTISKDALAQYLYGNDIRPGKTSSDFVTLAYPDGHNIRLFEVDSRYLTAESRSLPAYANSLAFKLIFRLPADVFRPFATALSPTFQVKNFIRDPLTGARTIMVQPDAKYTDLFALAKETAASFIDVTAHSAGVDGFFRNLGFKGVGSWTEMMHNLGVGHSNRVEAMKELRGNLDNTYGVNNVINILEHFSDKAMEVLSIPELINRQAVLRVLGKKRGITPETNLTMEQSMAARLITMEATTNFSETGASMGVLSHIAPFTGARMAELVKVYDDFNKNRARMAGYAAAVFTYGLWHALAHKDDRDYQEIPVQQRMGAITMRMNVGGVDKIAYLPLDTFSEGIWSMAQAIGMKASEDPTMPVSYYEIAKAIINNQFPLNSALNLAGIPIKEYLSQKYNYDDYTGKPIVPPHLYYTDERNQWDQFSSSVAKSAGEYAGLSPKRVDHIIHSFAPAVTQFLNAYDETVGNKKQNEFSGMNIFYKAITQARSAGENTSRSEALFQNNLNTYRGNKLTEDDQKATIRKELEKANQGIRDLTILSIMATEPKDKADIATAKRDLLDTANAIARGEGGHITTSSYHREAKQARKDQTQAIRGSLLAREQNQDTSFALEGDTSKVK